MSLITDLVLVTSMHETEAIATLNAWCARHAGFGGQTFGQLNGDGAGGRKFLCSEVWAMAGNYVADDLVAALPSFGWRHPEAVYLYVDHKGDETVVYSAVDTDAPLQLAGPGTRDVLRALEMRPEPGDVVMPSPVELARRIAAERLAHPLIQLTDPDGRVVPWPPSGCGTAQLQQHPPGIVVPPGFEIEFLEARPGDIVMLSQAELDRLTRQIMEREYPPGTVEDGAPAPVWDELIAEAAIHTEFLEAWRQKVRDAAALVGPSIMSAAIDTVQAVRNQFEPSYALVEFSEALIAQLMAVRRGEPWPVPEVAHADGPDAGCPHMEFEAGVTVQRILGDNLVVAGFWAEVIVACTRCDEVFRWTGVEPGLSPAVPRVSMDHRTLHAPFHRASRDPDEGQGLPGFDVNIIGPELGHERTAAAIRRRALEDAAELVKGRQTPVMSIAARRELRRAEAELRRLALAAP